MIIRVGSLLLAIAINLFLVGLFINTPQTLMAWGVLYFSLMTLCELAIFRKSAKRTRETRPGDGIAFTSQQKIS